MLLEQPHNLSGTLYQTNFPVGIKLVENQVPQVNTYMFK